MSASIFEIFKVGIGPSSSHTVGPMKASYQFASNLFSLDKFSQIDRVQVDLFGSLALTGEGHHTDRAAIFGLSGFLPEVVKNEDIELILKKLSSKSEISVFGKKDIKFSKDKHIVFHYDKELPGHPNTMILSAFVGDNLVLKETYYSIGGGFIVREGDDLTESSVKVEFDFHSADELLKLCEENDLTIVDLILRNERAKYSKDEVFEYIDQIWNVMTSCFEKGFLAEGILPGGLNVRRRAPLLFKKLQAQGENLEEPSHAMDWVSLVALATNEENASGGRVVTAPTNGAAGIIPATVFYYMKFCKDSDINGLRKFFLAAAAIGSLIKELASISAAELGCQGEVGAACAMAAAGLTAALGGSNKQIEAAAEMGIEHHLGLTCDPIKGLVQIPCIERNSMAAVVAINASRLARLESGDHIVSLDDALKTMKQTGNDMLSSYKETSKAGLAINVNLPEC